jgi:hypothetical protein
MSEQIWFKTPTVLFDKDTWSKFVPTKDMTTAEALNSVVRFSTYFSVILFVATHVGAYLMAIPVVMIATILLNNLFPNGKTIESFIAKEEKVGPQYTMPSKENPFMNVLISEIKYNPNRPPAADITKADMGDSLDSFFRVQWASDPTDVFGRTQSQRQFIAMPSTSIPNDQGSFMNWLYKIPGKTCKEGGKEACFPGTDGAVVPWLSNNR